MKRCLVFLVSVLAVLVLSSSSAVAVDCVATLTPDLKLHIPVLSYEGTLYSLDLQYEPSNDGNAWFGLTSVGTADNIVCDNASSLAIVSGAIQVHVPSVAVGAANYWATLEYVPDAAVGRTLASPNAAPALPQMRIKGVGNAVDDPLAPLVPASHPKNLHFFSAFQGEITGFDIAIYFKSWKFNVAVANNQPLGTPVTDNGAYFFQGGTSGVRGQSDHL